MSTPPTPSSPAFTVNTQTAGNQFGERITGLTGGGYVVTWTDLSGTLGDNSASSVKAQVFDASDNKIGTESLVNTTVVNDQSAPSVARLSNGGFVITWANTKLGEIG